MTRALDPFHRIRATIAAVFALVLLTMVVTTAAVAPRHARVSAAAIGAAALPSGTPAAGKPRPAHAPGARGARTGG